MQRQDNCDTVDDAAAPTGFCFFFEEERFRTRDQAVTPQEIRDIVGDVPSDVPIVQILDDGTQQQLQEGEEVRLPQCARFRRLPRFIRGRDQVRGQLEVLARRCSNLEVGADFEYVIVPEFRLPSGVFKEDTTDLLITIPPTYPTAPPDNFYVRWGLALTSGGTIQNYSGPVDLHGRKWGVFSFRIEAGAWRPATDAEQGDNLSTFLTAVRARLAEGA